MNFEEHAQMPLPPQWRPFMERNRLIAGQLSDAHRGVNKYAPSLFRRVKDTVGTSLPYLGDIDEDTVAAWNALPSLRERAQLVRGALLILGSTNDVVADLVLTLETDITMIDYLMEEKVW